MPAPFRHSQVSFLLPKRTVVASRSEHEFRISPLKRGVGRPIVRSMFDAWQDHKEEQAVAYDEVVSRLKNERDALQILMVVEKQGGTLGVPAASAPACA